MGTPNSTGDRPSSNPGRRSRAARIGTAMSSGGRFWCGAFLLASLMAWMFVETDSESAPQRHGPVQALLELLLPTVTSKLTSITFPMPVSTILAGLAAICALIAITGHLMARRSPPATPTTAEPEGILSAPDNNHLTWEAPIWETEPDQGNSPQLSVTGNPYRENNTRQQEGRRSG